MSKRLKIGLDMDGVLADFIGAFREEASIILNRQLLGEPTDWEFSNWMSKDEQDRVWDRIHKITNWWLTLKPLPGVYERLHHLAEKHELYFISTRDDVGAGEPVLRQTQRWVYRMAVPFPTVILCKPKGPVVSALKLDVFIDDKPENLHNIRMESPLTRLFLQDASHNQGAEIFGIRVNNFGEFIDELA